MIYWPIMRGMGIIAAVVLCLSPVAVGETPGDTLFQAIRTNDLSYLKAQLAKAADVNTRGRREMTLLMYAAAFGSPEAVKLLLDSGEDVNAKSSLDATALVWAAADLPKLRLLMDWGADVNARTKLGRTPLMIAATCDGCAENVRLLLAKGADPKAKDVAGNTPLALAAAAGDIETMRFLVAKGADADSVSSGALTPLWSAITHCNLEAIQLLLSKGARVNTAITDAGKVKFGPIALVNVTPLMTAAPYCHADVVKALLDAGADVKARDIRDMTPLMLSVASESQDAAVLRLLLQAGADINAKSKAGETALDWARKYGNSDVMAALDGHTGLPNLRGGQDMPRPAPATRLLRRLGLDSALGSVQVATALLERTSAEFFKQSGCVGCHHQPMAIMAASAARSAGVTVDETSAHELVKMIESEMTGGQET